MHLVCSSNYYEILIQGAEMNIALAAVGFRTGDVEYNKDKITETLRKYSKNNDLVVFGETFLQGFNCLSWNFERDKGIALGRDGVVIDEIRAVARDSETAVSFGYVERAGDALYSSQLTIGSNGEILDNFRRVSAGWKEPIADNHYCEGEGFHVFSLDGRSMAIGLCGDLWYDDNVRAMRALDADIVLWPVYTDFNFAAWNESIKLEYAEQAKGFGSCVLLVNSVCLETDVPEIARGGAACFQDGRIVCEVAAGKESVLELTV